MVESLSVCNIDGEPDCFTFNVFEHVLMLLQSYSIILLIPNINLRYCVAPRCGIIRNRASKFEFIKGVLVDV